MNTAVLCQFWPNKLQLSPETRQTARLFAWSLSQGEHWRNLFVFFAWLIILFFSFWVNVRVMTVLGLINTQRESVNPGQTVERDPKSKIVFIICTSDCVQSLAEGGYFHLHGCAATFWTKHLLLHVYRWLIIIIIIFNRKKLLKMKDLIVFVFTL